jgi:Phage integrase, N-terminal SAM-like domain
MCQRISGPENPKVPYQQKRQKCRNSHEVTKWSFSDSDLAQESVGKRPKIVNLRVVAWGSMSLLRYKGSKKWTMDFVFQGERIRESTLTNSKTLAKKIEDKRRQDLVEGRAGVVKPKPMQKFAAVADEYLELEEASLTPGKKNGAARTLQIDRVNIKHHLRPYFGKLLLRDIQPLTVKKYQQARLGEGAAPTTVNNEMGTFRSITTRSGHWARLLPDINMLAVDYEVGISLTAGSRGGNLGGL